jgi:hypothetical protein
VDYYDLEAQQISPMKTIPSLAAAPSLAAPSLVAADSALRMKKMKGQVKHLGHLCTGLGQALVALIEGLFVGLDLLPKGKLNKLNLGHAGSSSGSVPSSDPCSNYGSYHGLDPGSDLVSDHDPNPILKSLLGSKDMSQVGRAGWRWSFCWVLGQLRCVTLVLVS